MTSKEKTIKAVAEAGEIETVVVQNVLQTYWNYLARGRKGNSSFGKKLVANRWKKKVT